jgi:hypothetical protein
VIDIINEWSAWLTDHRIEAWTFGSIAALAILGVVVFEVTNRVRRSGKVNLKSAVGYGVVQVGMAYVTITGGYDFWRHVAHMPAFEAWAVAVIVESAQWWFIGRIFRYMSGHNDDGTRHEGYGPAGPKFWSAVIGGGVLAVVGAAFAPDGSLSLAVGRAVVVYIGSSMFDLLLRERVYWSDPDKDGRTTLLITPRRLAVKLGIIAAERRDLRDDDAEWTLRRMTRAIRWHNDGNALFKWMGTRSLRRSMEGGGSGLLRDATDRYAMTWVLVNEVNADSPTMATAIDRARQVLIRPVSGDVSPNTTEQPAPPAVDAGESPVVPDPEPVAPPVVPPAPRPLPVAPPARPAAPRVRQGGSNADAAALREQAVEWAVDQLRNGVRLTAKAVGTQFTSGEEWGRQRLNEARSRVGEVTTVNGRVPADV